MGPRFCKRGNLTALTNLLVMLRSLQWGHAFVSVETQLGLTQLAGREPHIWRVIGQNTPYMAVGMTQLGPNCVTPTSIKPLAGWQEWASMGPRFCKRGNVRRRSFASLILCRFNGATLL